MDLIEGDTVHDLVILQFMVRDQGLKGGPWPRGWIFPPHTPPFSYPGRGPSLRGWRCS